MENVPEIADMVDADGVPILDAICRTLEDGSFATVDAMRRVIKQQAGRAVKKKRRRGK